MYIALIKHRLNCYHGFKDQDKLIAKLIFLKVEIQMYLFKNLPCF